MAEGIMHAFLLYLGSDDDVRLDLDERIRSYKGERRDITRDVLVPFANEHGFRLSEEDVEYYNGHKNDGSEVPLFLFEEE